jgi:pilus assembly protein CpaF
MPAKDLHKALGPIASLFEDPEVTAVMVDGPDRVTIEKNGKIESTDIHFKSNEEVKAMVVAVLSAADIEMEYNKTIHEIRLDDNSRMTAILSPTAIGGHSVVFRKWMTRQLTWEKLFEFNSITPEARDLLRSALEARLSLLVAGGTSSGKTTLANRIVELVPPEERIVVVERTHEYQFDQPRAVFLEADATPGLSMNELLEAATKLRPDRLVIGELSGAEAMTVMRILGNGYTGITTLHADNLENALTRLEAMCLMANLGLGLGDIRQAIVSALRLVMYQECLEPNSNRKVTLISELRGLENGHYILQPLMRYDPESGRLVATGAKPGWE